MSSIIKQIKYQFEQLVRSIKNKNYREVFRVGIFVFLTLTIFTTFSFSRRAGFNQITNIVYALLLLTTLAYITIYGKFVFDYFFVLLAIFNAAVILSSLMNWTFNSQNFTIVFLSATIFTLYQYLVHNRENIKQFLLAFALGSIGYLLYFVIIYARPLITFDFSRRLGTYFAPINSNAMALAFIAVFFLYFATSKKIYSLYIVYFIAVWLLLSTGSMTYLGIVIIATLITIYLKIPKGQKYIFVIMILALIVIGLGILQIPQLIYFKRRVYGIIGNMFSVDTGSEDISGQIRAALREEMVLLFLRKPLLGFGPGQVIKYNSFLLIGHSDILELLANFGLVGFLAFEMFLITPIIKSFRHKPEYYMLGLLWALTIVISSLFFHLYLFKTTYLVIMFLYAITYNPENKKVFSLNIPLNKLRRKPKTAL